MSQISIFETELNNSSQPLAARMRPRSLDEFVGQEHLLGKGKVLRNLIERDSVSSMIFWGPPGVGKTTLAQIIAARTDAQFITFSAVTSGIKDIKTVMQQADRMTAVGARTIVFVDEIHRFNKAQQDAFLPFVEKGSIILIGATTENPSFEVNGALLSRCKVFVLQQLTQEDIAKLIRNAISDPRGFGNQNVRISDEVIDALAAFSNGDARTALSTLEMMVLNAERIAPEDAATSAAQTASEQSIQDSGDGAAQTASEQSMQDLGDGAAQTASEQPMQDSGDGAAQTAFEQPMQDLGDGAAQTASEQPMQDSGDGAAQNAPEQLKHNAADAGFSAENDFNKTGDAESDNNNMLHSSSHSERHVREIINITKEDFEQCTSRKSLLYDKQGEEHYNLISALHKSMRNSDADAAVYWLARMLESGEDPMYIARRVTRFAAEDVGLADPRALELSVAAFQACHLIGMPECSVHLSEAVIYNALAPKSNAIDVAYMEAARDAREQLAEPVPLQIRNAPTKLMKELDYGKGYVYAHDTEDKIADMECLPESLRGREYYHPGDQGFEPRFKERYEAIKKWRKEHKK